MATAIRRSVERFAAGLEAGGRVLDVGCGLKPYEECFANATYVGIDVEESGREASEKTADAYFNGLDIPYDEEDFDAVLCTEVLEHCVDPTRLLAEMHRVLKPGGRLLVTVPFIWGLHETPYDFRRYSVFGIERAMREAGFEIAESAQLEGGIDAIRMLVASEINNFEVNVHVPPTGRRARLRRRLRQRINERVWTLQLRLWRSLYRFERIYIDNMVVGVKT